jgi:6-phosphogluconolactonase
VPTPAEIVVHDGPDDVAEALAGRLTSTLADMQARGRTPQLCLTGGGIATKAYARLAQDGPGDVDWSAVHLWWGDERFVPAGDADRNADATLATLRGPLRLDDAHVHVMPAADAGLDLDEAAAAYAKELGGTVFDVCLLGMGPDGHVASLFPGHPSLATPGSVIPVRNSPKPPPDRISVTLDVINRSRQVWFCVSGAEKAESVAKGLLGTGPDLVPAARASGTEATVWLVDRAAVADLPDSVERLEG